MTTLRRAIYEGDRQLRRAAIRFGEEFRELRLASGLSQAAVARAIGVSRSVVCRMEAGDEKVAGYIRARAAAVLGAEFRFGLYPSGPALIRDAAQASLVERVLALRHPSWRATVEAPVPGPGRRSTDLRLERSGEIVLMEVETRIRSLETVVREGQEKRAAILAAHPGVRAHVVLVVPSTRHHREVARALPETIRAAFPVPSEELSRALRSEVGPWPGDGMLWMTQERGKSVGGRRETAAFRAPAR